MQLSSPAVAAVLAAAAARAFLVVPEIAQVDIDMAMLPPQNSLGQVINLKCPNCPIFFPSDAAGHRGFYFKQAVPTHLELHFSVDSAADADRLLVNGFELYPNLDPFSGSLTAPQVLNFDEADQKTHGDDTAYTATLGYQLAGGPVAGVEEDQHLQLLELELQIIEVGETFVDGVPTVRIRLVKNDGHLAIGSIETVDGPAVQASPLQKEGGNKECTSSMCRLHEIVLEKIAALKKAKGCVGRYRHRHGKGHNQGRPHGHHAGGMHGHHMHRHHHTWGQLLKNIASFILLPVLVGIVAGVALSLLGMVVGTFFIFLWRVFVRHENPFAPRRHHRHRRGHSCHKSNQHEAAVAEEKASLMAQQDMPPEYETAAPIATPEEAADDKA